MRTWSYIGTGKAIHSLMNKAESVHFLLLPVKSVGGKHIYGTIMAAVGGGVITRQI